MRLGSRQVRFTIPFLPQWGRKVVRLGGTNGGVQLQETALIVEGELLRFTFLLGIEWFIRRALSEWTTVTIPYSRIQNVRYGRTALVRTGLILAAVVLFLGGAVAFDQVPPAAAPVVTTLGIVGSVLLLYVAVRTRPTVRVTFLGKDGKRRVVAFVIRRRALRRPFEVALEAHRAAASTLSVPVAQSAR